MSNTPKPIKSHAKLFVSDHAIVRFMERILQIDVNEIRLKMASVELLKRVNENGEDGIYRCVEGDKHYSLVIEKGKIVTVLMPEKQYRQTRKSRAANIELRIIERG